MGFGIFLISRVSSPENPVDHQTQDVFSFRFDCCQSRDALSRLFVEVWKTLPICYENMFEKYGDVFPFVLRALTRFRPATPSVIRSSALLASERVIRRTSESGLAQSGGFTLVIGSRFVVFRFNQLATDVEEILKEAQGIVAMEFIIRSTLHSLSANLFSFQSYLNAFADRFLVKIDEETMFYNFRNHEIEPDLKHAFLTAVTPAIRL